MSETTETVSLHERLQEADKDREAGKHGVRYRFWATGDQLAAIEEAIEAPWRERVAELERELRRTNERDWESICKFHGLLEKEREEHDALKARADAICRVAKDVISNPSDYNISEMNRKIAAYDAADRAGETQEHKCVCTMPPESGMCDCMADQTAPSPTDATPKETWGQVKRRLAEWMSDYMMSSGMTDIKHPDHRAKLAWYLGCKGTGTPIEDEYLIDPDPSPADAAAEGEPLKYDPELAIDGLFPYIEDFDDRIRKLEDANIDIERWREGVDKHMDTHCTRLNAQRNALLANDERLVDLEQRLDALRGPEAAVTDEMMTAYWAASGTKDSEESIKRGLEAAFALRAGGAK